MKGFDNCCCSHVSFVHSYYTYDTRYLLVSLLYKIFVSMVINSINIAISIIDFYIMIRPPLLLLPIHMHYESLPWIFLSLTRYCISLF